MRTLILFFFVYNNLSKNLRSLQSKIGKKYTTNYVIVGKCKHNKLDVFSELLECYLARNIANMGSTTFLQWHSFEVYEVFSAWVLISLMSQWGKTINWTFVKPKNYELCEWSVKLIQIIKIHKVRKTTTYHFKSLTTITSIQHEMKGESILSNTISNSYWTLDNYCKYLAELIIKR